MKKKSFKILVSIVAFIIILLLLLPGILKRYVINHSNELVGRQIQIDKLKYNYFTSTIKVYDFKMLEQNEQDNFLSFDTLIVNLEPLQLFKDKIEIEEFYLKSLDVNVIMKDSVFNFDDLIDFFSTGKDTTNQNTDKDSFKFSISNIDLEESDFHFDNQNIEHTTHIENLSFLVPFIGWDQEEKSNADVKFNLPRGGYLESKFNINPIDGEYDADLTISDLYLDPFYKYVAEYVEINSFSGVVNSKIHIEGNTNEAVKSIVSGQVKVTDFAMTDINNKIFLSAKKMDAAIQNLDYFNNSYTIDSLKISDSYTFFQLDSITNNFYHIFKLDSSIEGSETKNQTVKTNGSTETVKSESENNLYYAINHLKINNSVIDYTDNLTGNPFDYHLSEIMVNSDTIFSDSDWVKIHSDMLLNNRGTLNAEIGFNPISLNDADLDIVIENFLLSDLNIYTKHYTGHNIINGDMYYYSNSKITNGNIVSGNKLLIKNVSLNNTEGGLYKLPLKFALFLLKDKNGDVHLEIPVRGDLNDPEISIGKIIWTTFKKRITGAASNPVNSLAGMVDVDPKEYGEFVFRYTDTIPSEYQFEKLDKLLEMETKKEGLKIELIHFVDKKLQNEAIAFEELGKQFNKETKKDYLKNEKDFETYLQDKVGSDSLSSKQAVLKLIENSKLVSLSNSYNQKLINNTNQYLQSSNALTNIEIKQSESKDPENIGSISRFKIIYKMLSGEKDLEFDETNTNQKK